MTSSSPLSWTRTPRLPAVRRLCPTPSEETRAMTAKIERLAAKSVFDPPAYTQTIKVTGAQTILFISGQVDYDAKGQPGHPGDFAAQARATYSALKAQVEAGGGTLQNIVKLTTFLVDIRPRTEPAAHRAEILG